jgi:hypothetical protein
MTGKRNCKERRDKEILKQSHACNDATFLGLNGGASDTVFARNIGLREENGNGICERKKKHR